MTGMPSISGASRWRWFAASLQFHFVGVLEMRIADRGEASMSAAATLPSRFIFELSFRLCNFVAPWDGDEGRWTARPRSDLDLSRS